MEGELPGLDALLVGGLPDEALGEDGALVARDHPARDIAAEHVEDHVQVEVGPSDRTTQLGDVPGEQLPGSGGQELGSRIAGMASLVAPLADLGVGGERAR